MGEFFGASFDWSGGSYGIDDKGRTWTRGEVEQVRHNLGQTEATKQVEVVSGFQETLATFDKMQTQLLTEVIAPAIERGTEIMQSSMLALVPVETGLLRDAIGTRMKTYKGSGVVWAGVGALRGMAGVVNGKKRDPAKYAHLADQGRSAVRVVEKKSLYDSFMGRFYGKSVGPAKGANFIAGAESAAGSAAVDAIQEEMDRRLAAITKE